MKETNTNAATSAASEISNVADHNSAPVKNNNTIDSKYVFSIGAFGIVAVGLVFGFNKLINNK